MRRKRTRLELSRCVTRRSRGLYRCMHRLRAAAFSNAHLSMWREPVPAPDRQWGSPIARLPHRGMQLASAAESARRHQRTGQAPSRHAKTHAAGSASQFSVTLGDVADKDASGLLEVAVSEVLLTKVTPAIGRRAASVVARAVSARPATGISHRGPSKAAPAAMKCLQRRRPDDRLPASGLEAASDDRHLAPGPRVGHPGRPQAAQVAARGHSADPVLEWNRHPNRAAAGVVTVMHV